MSKEQEQFLNWILKRAKHERLEELKTIMESNFKKQNDKQFTKDDLLKSNKKIIACLKDEYVNEYKKLMKQFGENL